MGESFSIQYRNYNEIDKTKWDKCIDEADNGLIYGYSFYLDHMAKHWAALVVNDYDAVMPLTWNKKYNINYLYQPPFTACLGIFGKNLGETIIKEFIEAMPTRFKLIEISLNHGNILSSPPGFLMSRTNYILSLNKPYDELYNGYRENHKRNLQKSLQAGCSVKKGIAIEDVIHLNKQQMKDIAPIATKDYDRFKKLYRLLSSQNKAISYGVLSKQNELLASCVFFFSHNRAYYIMVGNHPHGRDVGASHALIDAFIKSHAGENMILDFEGSDIESLALFYSGFGATREDYPAMRLNRLPWYLKWLKK